MKLNQKKIDRLKDKGRYGDGRNLYLHVGPTGSKSWLFLYRINGKNHQLGLGSLKYVSLEAARAKAAAMREMVKDGVNPLDLKPSRRKPQGKTFAEVADKYIAKTKPEWKNGGKSEGQWRSSLEAYVFPFIGGTDVAEIDHKRIFTLLEPIWIEKHETARKVRQRIASVLRYAAALEMRPDDNPARPGSALDELLTKTKHIRKPKKHAAMPYQELPEFLIELRKREAVAARALEFLILTAGRTSEVTNATWSEIDLEEGVWTIPAERMKADREHRVPLSPDAISLLKALPRDNEGDFVFISSMDAGKPISNMAMTAVLKRMDRKEGVTVHGFRSTFRDWAADETDHAREPIEMSLAHTVAEGAEAAYWRSDLFAKRTNLMDDWAGYCR